MKVYQRGDTYIAPKGSYFDGNVHIPGNFIVPAETHIWGRLDVEGCLELGPHSTVGEDVTCGSGVIGRGVRIKGALSSAGDVTVSDQAVINGVSAKGDIILRPGVDVGEVRSEATIYVYGKIVSTKLTGKNVKVSGN
ncbi:polymer-forming cytoskeletal protein [Methanofollis formosanus]|uniref:Polymer-forming cytoskeletal protein n=1 Tax=Methanofollis formosanus TaxID=299308 RepID=A0A8G1EGG9_9EURY|nr:polymer-forming cytoskeletal protein [Methanofollis formosanus]QYZ79785.1 polymer-forming cytoskeletal protein [Methanofollis formosanus]